MTNAIKVLLQKQSGFLQLESIIVSYTECVLKNAASVEGYGGSTLQKSGYDRAFL
jgi:hypothetical protein